MIKTTVKELGATLPIGFVPDKSTKLIKTFSLRPYKSKIDRVLNVWREANKGKSLVWLVVKFLSLIVEEAGGQHFTLDERGDSTPEHMNRILDWNFADALYMYLWAGIQVCNERVVPYGCPNVDCSLQTAEKIIDLTSIEVQCAESVKDCRFTVELRDGFRLANERLCRKIGVRSVPFRSALLAGGTEGSVDSLSYNQLREAVVSVDGGGDGYVLADMELDEMSKWDQLILNSYSARVTAGIKMRTDIVCDRCRQPISRALDWRFDHFFETSIPASLLMT